VTLLLHNNVTVADDENAQKLVMQSQAAAERLDMFLMFLRVSY